MIPLLPRSLRGLNLRFGTTRIKLDSIAGLYSVLKRLKVLQLSLPALRHRDVDGYVCGVLIPQILTHCGELRSLLMCYGFGDIDFSGISSMKHLNVLVMDYLVSVEVARIINKAAPASLDTIVLDHVSCVNFSAVAREFTNIRKLLIISTKKVSDFVLDSLSDESQFPNLQEVMVGFEEDSEKETRTSVTNRAQCVIVPKDLEGYYNPRWCHICGKCRNFDMIADQCRCL